MGHAMKKFAYGYTTEAREHPTESSILLEWRLQREPLGLDDPAFGHPYAASFIYLWQGQCWKRIRRWQIASGFKRSCSGWVYAQGEPGFMPGTIISSRYKATFWQPATSRRLLSPFTSGFKDTCYESLKSSLSKDGRSREQTCPHTAVRQALNKSSRWEGFLSCWGWQIMGMIL